MMLFPPPNLLLQEENAKLKIKDRERRRDLRLAQEDTSTQRNGISSRASALIAFIVVVLLLIVGMVVLFHVL